MYFAKLYIGEGTTINSKFTVLGTPAIYVNSLSAGTLEEQEHKYGLIFCFDNGKGVVEKGLELLKKDNLKIKWQRKREKLLNDKIDVTAFIIDFIEKYPNKI